MQRQNNDQTAGKCQIHGTKKEMGGLGEVIFIGIIEFDPSFKGSLTCVWRKGSGEVKGGGHSFISSFSRCIYYVPDTVLGIGHRVEKGQFFCPCGTYFLVGEDGRTADK